MYRYLVFVSHLFQNPRAKYHCNSKICFLKIDTQQECRKKIIEIFNEKPLRLQKTIARLASVNQKTVSKIILKQYNQSLSIKRKRGSGRKKGFTDQNKASKIIRIFLKHSNMPGRKVAQKLGFY